MAALRRAGGRVARIGPGFAESRGAAAKHPDVAADARDFVIQRAPGGGLLIAVAAVSRESGIVFHGRRFRAGVSRVLLRSRALRERGEWK
jgi:hypothetical protein